MSFCVSTTKYDDIISLPHHRALIHRMPLSDRAAQFSPFSALTGLEAELDETARLTDEAPILTEGQIDAINERLKYIQARLPSNEEFELTYFQPDALKSGGQWVKIKSSVKKLDPASGLLTFPDGQTIPIQSIIEIK